MFILLFPAGLIASSLDSLWQQDLESALQKASEENKQVLMVFSGSDWCRPCMQFRREVLHNPQFIQKVKDDLVILYVDFPRRRKNRLTTDQKDHNASLADKFNPNGVFPLVLLLDKEGKKIARLENLGQGLEIFLKEYAQFKEDFE